MSAASVRAHGITRDDTFVACACSLDTAFLDLDAMLSPHAMCGGDTTKL